MEDILYGSCRALHRSLCFSLQIDTPAFCFTWFYSVVVFTLHQLQGGRKGIFLYINCLGDFLQLLEGYVCYLYCNLDSIDIWQKTQFSRKQKILTDGKQRRAIQEQSCQRRSMNLKFTVETRLLP